MRSKVLDVVVGDDESLDALTSEFAPDRRDRDVEMTESEGRQETELKRRSHRKSENGSFTDTDRQLI